MFSDDWFQNQRFILVMRFLGTTPNSGTMVAALFSICQQISYNLELPMEDVPQDFVPLKNYFKILLDKAQDTDMIILIVLGENNNRQYFIT